MQNLLKQETIRSSNSYSMNVYLKEKKKKKPKPKHLMGSGWVASLYDSLHSSYFCGYLFSL